MERDIDVDGSIRQCSYEHKIYSLFRHHGALLQSAIQEYLDYRIKSYDEEDGFKK